MSLACACGRAENTVSPPQNHATADPKISGTVAIDHIPALPLQGFDHGARDCRLSAVTRRRFAHHELVPCGELSLDVEHSEIEDARRCVADAISHHEPFLVEQHIQGIDSEIAVGLVGLVDGGVPRYFELDYDGDPCGGSCPQRGGTHIRACSTLTRVDDCLYELAVCWRCPDHAATETCAFGDGLPIHP